MGCFNARKAPLKKVIFIIGGPGSGKGTQCKKISSEFNFEHLSTGNILRNVVDKKQAPGWQELKQKMESGAFVSSSELISFVKEEFKSINKTILLDGFPRNKENVDEWNNQMTNICEVAAVLYFECSTDEMKKRLMGRNEGRSDDNEETISKRIDNFNKDTLPVLSEYEKNNKLIKINAEKSVDEIFEDVKSKIKELKLDQK